MNRFITYSLSIFLCLAGSLLWLDSASAGKPAKVFVTAANPSLALQGEALDVVISGSGFGHGATVRFLVSNTQDDAQVEITGTVLFDEMSGNLIAPIQVLDGAIVDFYDVEVLTSSGRRGKGTDLFSVVLNENGGGGNQGEDGTAVFSGVVEASLMGSFVDEVGSNDFEIMDGQLTGVETLTVKGEAALILMFFDDECRKSPADPELCSIYSAEKGVLPLGVQRLPASCGELPEPPCVSVKFTAASSLQWKIRLDHDKQPEDRVQFKLTWNNEDGQQHLLKIGWLRAGMLDEWFGEMAPGTPSNSLRASSVEFMADPFSLRGAVLVGKGKKSVDWYYSEYEEDYPVTFFIDTFVP